MLKLMDTVYNRAIQYEVNDKTLAGQILDKILAGDRGVCRLIFDHGASRRLFKITKSSCFPKEGVSKSKHLLTSWRLLNVQPKAFL